MKTVIHVWSHAISNYNVTPLDGRFGLGDLLRGAIGTLQYCEDRGYNCIIDTSLHPLSQLLVPVKHAYSDLIWSQRNNIRGIFSDVTQFLDNELQTKDVVFFFSNFGLDVYNRPRTPYVVSHIQTVLALQPTFKAYVDTMIRKLPYPKFSVLHFRLGDSELISGNTPSHYADPLAALTAAIEPHQILMSDSAHFKRIARNRVFTFDEPVAHLGYHTGIDDIKHTLFEFILLMNATHIRTYSVYGWTSGFVQSVHYLFTVPLSTIGR